jgi:hypothetical protein
MDVSGCKFCNERPVSWKGRHTTGDNMQNEEKKHITQLLKKFKHSIKFEKIFYQLINSLSKLAKLITSWNRSGKVKPTVWVPLSNCRALVLQTRWDPQQCMLKIWRSFVSPFIISALYECVFNRTMGIVYKTIMNDAIGQGGRPDIVRAGVLWMFAMCIQVQSCGKFPIQSYITINQVRISQLIQKDWVFFTFEKSVRN